MCGDFGDTFEADLSFLSSQSGCGREDLPAWKSDVSVTRQETQPPPLFDAFV